MVGPAVGILTSVTNHSATINIYEWNHLSVGRRVNKLRHRIKFCRCSRSSTWSRRTPRPTTCRGCTGSSPWTRTRDAPDRNSSCQARLKNENENSTLISASLSLTHVPVVVVPGCAVHPWEGSVLLSYFPRYPGVLGMREMRGGWGGIPGIVCQEGHAHYSPASLCQEILNGMARNTPFTGKQPVVLCNPYCYCNWVTFSPPREGRLWMKFATKSFSRWLCMEARSPPWARHWSRHTPMSW